MVNKQNESDNIEKTKDKIKSQAILETAISSLKTEKETYSLKTSTNSIGRQTINLEKNTQFKVKKFYKKYKNYLTSTIYLLNKFKYKKYNIESNFSKYKKNQITKSNYKFQAYLNKIIIIKLNLHCLIKNGTIKVQNRTRKFQKAIVKLKPFLTNSTLRKSLIAEKYILYYSTILKDQIQNNVLINQKNFSKLIQTNQEFKTIQSKLTATFNKISNSVNSLDKNKFLKYLDRFGFILKIYFLPFIFLANQALVPFIQEYEELIVNAFSSVIFEKIPFLVGLIKLFNPIINSFNKMFQFWILIAYFLIFPLGYRALKLSYKLGYNGSIALIFLLINSSLSFSQEIIIAMFESLKMIKDILFTSYLVKHLGKSKNKEREEALRIFTNLVQRYELAIKQDYFNWLLFLNHYVLSPLAFISLAVLVYNCLYYMIYNKNPKIPLVTKAALATIKNPQEGE